MLIKKYARPLLCVYGLIMLILLFGRTAGDHTEDYWAQIAARCNLVPFELTRHFLYLLTLPEYRAHAIVNLVGNVVMFVPLGGLLPLAFPRLSRLWKTLPVVLGIMYVAETVQLFTLLGFFDVDDLILNTFGAAIGYGLYKLIFKTKQSDSA